MQDKQMFGWELRCERNPATGETRKASKKWHQNQGKCWIFFLANDTILCFITTWWIRETRKIPKSPHTNTTAVGEACGAVMCTKIFTCPHPFLWFCYSFSFCHRSIFFTLFWLNVFFFNIPLLNGLERNYSTEWLGSYCVFFLSPFTQIVQASQKGLVHVLINLILANIDSIFKGFGLSFVDRWHEVVFLNSNLYNAISVDPKIYFQH